MTKYKAYYFNGDKLINSTTIFSQNKSSALESFKQSLMLDSTENLSVELYEEQKIRYYIENGYLLKITQGSIEVQGERPKKKLVRVNWMNELNISAYYNEEEVEQIQQNIQAMMDFVPEEIVSEEGEVSYTQFEFPHQVEERYKEVDSHEKEKYTVETLQPLQIIS
jgi:hypothetical protein